MYVPHGQEGPWKKHMYLSSSEEFHLVVKKGGKYAGAEERATAAAKRTPQEQLDILDKRLGVGVGAKKERAKLKAKIEATKEVAEMETATKVVKKKKSAAKKAA